MRKCEDGALHEDALELVMSDTPASLHEPYSEDMGRGAVIKEEAAVEGKV